MYSVIFHPLAEKEFFESFEYYENQISGLGNDFIKTIDKTINIISKTPQVFPFKHKKLQEASLKKFPFVIVYKVNEKQKTIFILSVFHTSRNPSKKRKR